MPRGPHAGMICRFTYTPAAELEQDLNLRSVVPMAEAQRSAHTHYHRPPAATRSRPAPGRHSTCRRGGGTPYPHRPLVPPCPSKRAGNVDDVIAGSRRILLGPGNTKPDPMIDPPHLLQLESAVGKIENPFRCKADTSEITEKVSSQL
jgi:hypothetical protein